MLEGKIQRLKRVEFGHKKGLFLSLGKEVGGGALKITVLLICFRKITGGC